MADPEDTAARLTLKIAGVFQEVRDTWARRLDAYYDQLESLVDGQWLDSNDLKGVINESKLASREALDGLGNDLAAELVHASRGIVAKYEYERASFTEEIVDLRSSLANALSGDENTLRRENESLKEALLSQAPFVVLNILRIQGPLTYEDLVKACKMKKTDIRKHVKELQLKGYVTINKKNRPHSVVFVHAPWRVPSRIDECSYEFEEGTLEPRIAY